jgi:hypothetical protein
MSCSSPSATVTDAVHVQDVGEELVRQAHVVAGGRSLVWSSHRARRSFTEWAAPARDALREMWISIARR